MALNRNPVRAEGRDLTIVSGSFAPNGASAIVATSNRGAGFTVARTGVGAFLLTLAEKYQELTSISVNLQLAVLADSDVIAGVFTPSTATTPATLVLAVATAGVAAEIAANANNRIHFVLHFRRTSSTI